jgi:hypothetical protein
LLLSLIEIFVKEIWFIEILFELVMSQNYIRERLIEWKTSKLYLKYFKREPLL